MPLARTRLGGSHSDEGSTVPTPSFSLPESLFDRLFNLHTGTPHDFYCPSCQRVTKHFSTTHSALTNNALLKLFDRIFADLTGVGNLIEGKPYVCTVCGTVWFE